MGYLFVASPDGRHFTVRVPRQPRHDVIDIGIAKPIPARVYPIHDRSNVPSDVLQFRPRARKEV